jgi:Autotransporter beta-domain
MRHAIPRFFKLAVSLGITGLFAIWAPADLRAQTIFCPATFPDSTGTVALKTGSCTDGNAGAFSGAALASQALSELSQTTTQVTTKEIGKSIVERREQERERCPAGFSRVDGACRPTRPPVREPARAVPREKPTPAAVVKAPPPPPLPIEPAVRFGTWAQVYGDYQKRDAAGPGFLNCCASFPLGGGPAFNVPPQLALKIESRAATVGFVAGADLTSRGVFFANDGVIGGVTAGYTSSVLKLNTVATDVTPIGDVAPGNPQRVGTGVSNLRATVSGPTVGGYATYFNGGFSSDVTLKLDFLTLNETFNDLLATTENGPPPFIPFSGAGSVNLLNSTVVGNLNYRFDLYPNFWIEPTVGAQYINSSYGSGAAQLGLADGYLIRVQGGARFGTSTLLSNGVLMTTTLTGLAYNDVVVQGGFVPAFASPGNVLLVQTNPGRSVPVFSQGNNLLVQADQGLMRGQGIFALNFDFGRGVSSFVQGDVYGGAHLFGAGGRAGLRYQW